MKKLVKIVASGLAVLTLCNPILTEAYAAEVRTENVALRFNGKTIEMPTAPYAENYVTVVPARSLAEALGAKVTYSKPNIIIEKDNTVIKFVINEDTAYVNGVPKKIAHVAFLDNKRYISIDNDHEHIWMPGPGGPKNILMVPLRFICEELGAKIQFEDG